MTKRKMSAELKAMLDCPRKGPMRPRIEWTHDGLVETNDTRFQRKLEAWATGILAKSGYFQPKADRELIAPPADAVGAFGLRPVWHGRP